MSRSRIPLPMWEVTLDKHVVPPRWFIPYRVVTVPAVDETAACLRVIRWAHSDALVPPWKPYTRHSMRFATAKRTDAVPDLAAPASDRQLELRAAA
jgi:hypothetical protein